MTAAVRESALAKLLREELSGGSALAQLLASYLDFTHVRQEQPPCPLAFLATDVANREDEVRAAYNRVFKRLISLVKNSYPQICRHTETEH